MVSFLFGWIRLPDTYESALTDMTTVASAVLFRSESRDIGFQANERS